MDQLNFHNNNFETIKPHPRLADKEFFILFETKSCYKIWCDFLSKIPRHIRYTLAVKIDNLFTDILEIALLAKFAKPEEKIIKSTEMDKKLCVLKDFITTLWEIKAIDEHKYGLLADKLITIGRMIGKFLNKKTAQTKTE
ncbi:MAG: four helix bundle protein [Candidatus Magasanikbacteria bacterium]|nr:four helix bundle protein [Candidatus Magasanikbacteria bacterium]